MNTNPEVDAWFAEYEHPVKDTMLAVRGIVLSDGRMSETIKWKSPTFMYKGNLASFNLRTKVNAVLAREMETETPITLEWYAILLILAQTEDAAMRPSDLADQIGLSRSATTRLVDRLEADGLVERRACESDRRGTFVLLTPRGQEVFKQAGRVHLRGIDEHVGSHFTDEELAQLAALLGKLADRVGGEALSTLTPNSTP